MGSKGPEGAGEAGAAAADGWTPMARAASFSPGIRPA